MSAKEIRPGGESVTCPTCGGLAVTLSCRVPFAPPIKALDTARAWQEIREIVRSARYVFDGCASELDAVDYIHERIEQTLRALSATGQRGRL